MEVYEQQKSVSHLSEGDVVKSADFVLGDRRTGAGDKVFVGYNSGDRHSVPANDEARAGAKFVVESTVSTGSGATDGVRVYARRLNDDDTFNEWGEQIVFYISGSQSRFGYLIRSVTLVGKMKKVYV